MSRAGAIVPHAPVLLDAVTPRPVQIDGLDQIGALARQAPLCLVVSPHGRATGVYAGVIGDLDGLGFDKISVTATTDAGLVKELADVWDKPILDGPVDHGITTPLALLSFTDVVACAFEDVGSDDPAAVTRVREDALRLADAIGDRDVFVLASAHGSAAATPRAPLTERPEGKQLDETILKALAGDPSDLEKIDAELWARAGSCGAGPLVAFGRLFGGSSIEVFGNRAPYGVTYITAVSP